MPLTDIFFDLDNTLWDFEANSHKALSKMFVEHQISEKYKVEFEDFHQIYIPINANLWDGLQKGTVTKDELRSRRFKHSFAHFGIDNHLPKFFEDNYLDEVAKFNDLVEGAQELLDYLHPKYKLHILTNGFEEISYKKLRSSHIEHYFETITSADELMVRKPDPKIFQHSLDKAKTTAENSLYIGDDWLADAVGATQMNMQAIYFERRFEEKKESIEVQIVQKLVEIKEIL